MIDCRGWDDSVVDRVQLTGGTISAFNCEKVTSSIIELRMTLQLLKMCQMEQGMQQSAVPQIDLHDSLHKRAT